MFALNTSGGGSSGGASKLRTVSIFFAKLVRVPNDLIVKIIDY